MKRQKFEQNLDSDDEYVEGGLGLNTNDFFFQTISNRGFFHNQDPNELIQNVDIYEYDELCRTIETYMYQYNQSNFEGNLATYIINSLIRSSSDLTLVSDNILTIWASVVHYRRTDELVRVYNDFLNDKLKGRLHLPFFIKINRVISRVIYGDQFSDGDGISPLNDQYIKCVVIPVLISQIFTQNVFHEIYLSIIPNQRPEDKLKNILAQDRFQMGQHELIRVIQSPSSFHTFLCNDILRSCQINFQDDGGLTGWVQGRDLQISMLREFSFIIKKHTYLIRGKCEKLIGGNQKNHKSKRGLQKNFTLSKKNILDIQSGSSTERDSMTSFEKRQQKYSYEYHYDIDHILNEDHSRYPTIKSKKQNDMTSNNQFSLENAGNDLQMQIQKQFQMKIDQENQVKSESNQLKTSKNPQINEKIDQMIKFKKKKDMKKLLQNPPKKVQALKSSKEVPIKHKYSSGVFGPERPRPVKSKRNGKQTKTDADSQASQSISSKTKLRKSPEKNKDEEEAEEEQPINSYDAYLIDEMYMTSQLASFANPEIRLKQLILKLQHQEKLSHELKYQVKVAKLDISEHQRMAQMSKAMEIGQNLKNILNEIKSITNENLNIKKKSSMPVQNTIGAKERIKENLYQSLLVLGYDDNDVGHEEKFLETSGDEGGDSSLEDFDFVGRMNGRYLRHSRKTKQEEPPKETNYMQSLVINSGQMMRDKQGVKESTSSLQTDPSMTSNFSQQNQSIDNESNYRGYQRDRIQSSNFEIVEDRIEESDGDFSDEKESNFSRGNSSSEYKQTQKTGTTVHEAADNTANEYVEDLLDKSK